MAGIESLGTVRFLIFEFKGVFRFGDKFRGEMNVSFFVEQDVRREEEGDRGGKKKKQGDVHNMW